MLELSRIQYNYQEIITVMKQQKLILIDSERKNIISVNGENVIGNIGEEKVSKPQID